MDILKAGGLCVAFIGAIYLWPSERKFVKAVVTDLESAAMDQDMFVERHSTHVIQRRTLSFLLGSGCSAWYLFSTGVLTEGSQWRGVGRCVATTAALFLGPMLEITLEGEWGACAPSRPIEAVRNTILCPIGEELFFRGVLYHVLRERSSAVQIVTSALLFAATHAHHIFVFVAEEYQEERQLGEKPSEELVQHSWATGARQIAKVLTVTSVFGVLSGYYYVYTCERSVLSVAAVHSLCNFFGAPSFSFLSRHDGQPPAKRLTVAAAYGAGVALWAAMMFA